MCRPLPPPEYPNIPLPKQQTRKQGEPFSTHEPKAASESRVMDYLFLFVSWGRREGDGEGLEWEIAGEEIYMRNGKMGKRGTGREFQKIYYK